MQGVFIITESRLKKKIKKTIQTIKNKFSELFQVDHFRI